MAGRLKDKVAIVTGAGRGIGEAIARAFAAEGASVIVAEKAPETGRAVTEHLVAAGAQSLFIETDVAQSESCQRMVDDVLARFGRIDVLVNNAGVNVFHEPLETSEEEWRRCFAVDLDGAWHCCKAALPKMRERHAGAIVNVASCH